MHILNYINLNITVLLTNKTIIFGGCLIPLILFILINVQKNHQLLKKVTTKAPKASLGRTGGGTACGGVAHGNVFLGTMGWRKKQFE